MAVRDASWQFLTFHGAMRAKNSVLQRLSKSLYVQISDRHDTARPADRLPIGTRLTHHHARSASGRRTAPCVNLNQSKEIHMSMRQSAIKHDAHYNALPPALAAPSPQPHQLPSSGASERLLRLPELIRTIGVSRATIYRYIDNGRLPPPVKLSTRCVAWRASEITAWMAALRAG
jgi:prophage regulatory protein